MDEADLQRLCDHAGLQREYWDGLGQHRTLSLKSCRTILSAMGIDVDGDDDPATMIARYEDRSWHSVLPPVMVCRQHSPDYHIPIALPADRWNRPVDWVLVQEDGTRHRGQVKGSKLHLWARRRIDGRDFERRGFDRLPELPPGYHKFELPGLADVMPFIMAPDACFRPDRATDGDRSWGLSVQLYGLRSHRNWGIGDLGDLKALGLLAAKKGASFIGINPLHAHALTDPDHRSPYAASSRLFLDPIYLDVEAVTNYRDCDDARRLVETTDFQSELARLRDLPLVDYEAVATTKLQVLQTLYEHFRRNVLGTGNTSAQAFEAFVDQCGTEVHRYAIFETIRAHQPGDDGKPSRPDTWPAPLQDPDSTAVKAFAEDHAEAVGFHLYLQWQTDAQMSAVTNALRTAGMDIGLYRDLAIGPSPDGAERWAYSDTFAPGINAGAPPDAFSRDGQNWNLPVFSPEKLRAAAYGPFVRLLRENMKHAGALRIDHVMGLTRLFWIPESASGSDGGYVAYPAYDLIGIVALESQRNRCVVVGEDLGSVPEGFRHDLAKAGILGTRVLLFERDQEGRFLDPRGYPEFSIAAASTHDLPPLAGFWTGEDIRLRQTIADPNDPAAFEREQRNRADDRARLLELLAVDGPNDLVAPESDAPIHQAGLAPAIHALLRRSPCLMVQYQLDDVVEETTPVNIPGTWREYPNWRRKQSLAIEDLAVDPRFNALPNKTGQDRSSSA